MWHRCQPLINARRFLLSFNTLTLTDTVLQRAGISAMGPARRPTVLVTRQDVAKEALDLLTDKCDVEVWNEDKPISRTALLQKIAGKDALFCLVTEKVDSELLDAAGSSLKVIGTMSVGYDHIDISQCTKSGEWAKQAWSPTWMCGSEIRGSTVGIVGMGNIGFGILERLKAFKASKFLYFSRGHKPAAEALGAQFTRLDELLKLSDFVIACCALTPETKGLFNKEAFSMMKSTATFINISRGQVVDQDALYEALSSGKIRSAGLDVMTPEPLPVDDPLLKLPNCVILPHIGSAATETRTAMAVLTAQNILAALDGISMPAMVC
uniref:Glyoxylate reductase/hydroxypyruvate reductase n=1 Tax=Amblyomma cajennense TaxID=34607 RepID=A0A023FK67_AMBCJ